MKGDIGVIGLAVMGQNLILNMNDKGFTVVAYNRTVEKVDEFLNNAAKNTRIIGAHSLQELVDNLKKPRKIMMMVRAGQAVDDLIAQSIPCLDEGDILIDGGNANYPDTNRRCEELVQGCQVAKKGRVMAHQLCLVDTHRLGNIRNRFFKPLQPKHQMANLVAIGSATTAQGILLKWYTMGLNTVICN